MNNWLALYIAVIWYCEITPEQAIGHLEGRIRLALPKMGDIDDYTTEQIYRIVKSNNFHNIDMLERVFKLHRCDMCKAILRKYGGDAMSVCGDECKHLGTRLNSHKKKRVKVSKVEMELLRERTAIDNTTTAKAIMQSLKIGAKVIVAYKKRTSTVVITAKNDRILTVKDNTGRIGTIHIADIVTKEAKIQETCDS